MSKNALATVMSILVGLGFPVIQFITQGHFAFATDWPMMLAGAFAIGFGYFTNNQANYGASAVNVMTTVFSVLIGVCIGIQPVVATGVWSTQSLLVAATFAVGGYFMNNPDEKAKIQAELDQYGSKK